MQNSVGQQYQVPQYQCQCQCQCQQAYTTPVVSQPQPVQPPQQVQVTTPQGQSVQVPNYSGVNIQIFNPTVTPPGGSTTYNVNAPQYSYPADYYTGQYATGINQNGTNVNGANNNGTNTNGVNSNGNNNGANANGANSNGNNNNGTNTNGVNSNGTDNNSANVNDSNANSINTNNTNTTINNGTKKEKRDIVILTDEYIKNLETYLNSPDKQNRLTAAKEVVARLEEDDSRKDDKALTALINKMIQDPATEIRLLGLSMLNGRKVTGDDYTKQVLEKMQQSKAGYGQDSIMASNILLKMSGQIGQKEFDVPDKPKKVVSYKDYMKGNDK